MNQQYKLLTNWSLVFLMLLCSSAILEAQPCTLTNGAGCDCPDGSDTCDLIPDITISWDALANYSNGPDEYSQNDPGPYKGQIRVSSSTPNLGYGPFVTRGSDYFLCDGDTIYSPGGMSVCPGTGSEPQQLLLQRIYRKEGVNITYQDRWGGSQTYHPQHGHMHVDDWVHMTLRLEDPFEPDTLNWPIIGTGSKVGFCLMDFGSCDFYNGHCRDDNTTYNQGNILNNTSIPNFGMGGGSYGCSPVEQGISVGYTDIYSEVLYGMSIDIPAGTCNGDYWIVVEVDYRDNFLETNENNNWTAIPITLTEQVPSGNVPISIVVNGSNSICEGDTAILSTSVNNPEYTYIWSTGDTAQFINVTAPGTYTVSIITACGSGTSLPVEITSTIQSPVTNDTILCATGSATLTASGTGIISWFSDAAGTELLHTGPFFTSPEITESTTFYVRDSVFQIGATSYSSPHSNSIGAGGYYNGNNYLVFDAYKAFTIESVKVYAFDSSNRTIELRDASGNILESKVVFIPQGESRVNLAFPVYPGMDYQLACKVNSFHNLYRNNGGVSYPYTIPGVLSIQGSSIGSSYYYSFYDWEVKELDINCISNLVPATISVMQLPSISQDSSGLVSSYGETYQWYFNGNILIGDTLQSTIPANSGVYQVAITNNGCTLVSDSFLVQNVACGTPTNLTYSTLGYTKVRLEWQPVNGSDAYEIRGKRLNGSTWVSLSVNGGGTANRVVNGLLVNEEYIWQIRSVCDTIFSPYSDFDTILISENINCTVPSSISVSGITTTTAILNWQEVPDAHSYRIEGRLLGNSNSVYKKVLAGQTSKALQGLNPTTSYEWRMRAICDPTAVVTSNYTSWDTFTTQSPNKIVSKEVSTPGIGSIRVYPNPFDNYTVLEIPNVEKDGVDIQLMDLSGKVILSYYNVTANKVLIYKNELSSGFYMLQVFGQHTYNQKILVK